MEIGERIQYSLTEAVIVLVSLKTL